jgi:hypothetical protein
MKSSFAIAAAYVLAVSFLIACAVFMTTPRVHAQVVDYPLNFSKHEQTTPAFVPNTITDVWTQDVYLEVVTLSNESASAVTCTIQDKQATPRAYFKTVSLAANSTYNDAHVPSRWFPSGLSWSCSAPSAVTGYLRASY